jgi:hypothetical protein
LCVLDQESRRAGPGAPLIGGAPSGDRCLGLARDQRVTSIRPVRGAAGTSISAPNSPKARRVKRSIGSRSADGLPIRPTHVASAAFGAFPWDGLPIRPTWGCIQRLFPAACCVSAVLGLREIGPKLEFARGEVLRAPRYCTESSESPPRESFARHRCGDDLCAHTGARSWLANRRSLGHRD